MGVCVGGGGGSTLQSFYTLLWNMLLNKCLMINLCMLILCVLCRLFQFDYEMDAPRARL